MPNVTVYQNKKEPSLLRGKADRIDLIYLTVVVALVVIGLIVLLSASFAKAISDGNDSYFYFIRQLRAVLLGSVFAVFFIFVPDWMLQVGGVVVSWVCTLLLVLVLIIPTQSTERRWIYLGSFQLQPSEFAKLALIIVLATYFTLEESPLFRNQLGKVKNSFARIILLEAYPYLLCAVYFFLILVETHLSGAALIAIISFSMIIASRKVPWKVLFFVFLGVLAVAAIFLFTNQYMLDRVLVYLGIEGGGDDYQITQSYLAIGSGGLSGVGLGKSRQKYLYLPEPQNDFIFAIACEELGFIGAGLIVALFILLICRGITIALRSRSKFRSLVALGITFNLGSQIVLNLLVVTGIFPVTGISLPFFSYGGTAIIVQLAEVGMMLRISRFADLEPLPKKTEVEALPQ